MFDKPKSIMSDGELLMINKLTALFMADKHLMLWGVKESLGEYNSVIEDTESGALLKIKYEPHNDVVEHDPFYFFMAKKIGWSPLGFVLSEHREKAKKEREENRKIAEQNAADGIYND